MWNYTHSDELCHYGVLGMKWGVRKMRKDLRTKAKAHKRAIKDAETKADKKAAKASYKEFKKAGRTKGQRAADFWFARPKDVRAYMDSGMSHSEAFKRSFGDTMLSLGIVSTAATIGKKAVEAYVRSKYVVY